MIVWFSCKGDAEPGLPQSHGAEASPTFQPCWDNNQLQAVKRLQQTAKRRTSSSVGTHTHLSHSCLALLTGLSGRCWLPGFWAERDFPHRRLKSREYAWGNHSHFTHVEVDKSDRWHKMRALFISSVLRICCAICHAAAHGQFLPSPESLLSVMRRLLENWLCC